MRVEVLSTGTEILRGRNIDTHLSWLACRLEEAGLEVLHHQAVDDHRGRLVDAIKLAAARSDIILLTGGLGPTEDDLTREAAAEAFHRPLVFRPAIWSRIRRRFRRHRLRMAAINRRQACVPRGARSLPNPEGTAPGFLLREGGVLFAALPGPPHEMRPMFLRRVLPRIRAARRFDFWEAFIFGVPEGTVDETLRRIVKGRAAYGLMVRGGEVGFSIRAEGPRRKEVLRGLSRRVRAALGDDLLESRLPEEVARRLISTRTTLAVAESCTGGLIAHKLTEIPGISEVLLESVVAYSNGAKTRRLGVPEGLLREHGAVSPEVARAMARGAARTGGAELGVAVTGIAGPGGGSKAKPAGLCYVAVGGRVERRVFPGDRGAVKDRAANFALDMVRRELLRRERDAGKKMGLRAR